MLRIYDIINSIRCVSIKSNALKMFKLIAVFVATLLVASGSVFDVADTLSCVFKHKNYCQWKAGGDWQFGCDRPQFCYVKTAQYSNVANLRSITFNSTHPICLNMRYKFDAIGFSTITVYVSGRKVFMTSNAGEPSGWRSGNMTIEAGTGQQMVLGATRSRDFGAAYVHALTATRGAC